MLNCWYGYFLFVRSCIFSRFVFFPIRPVCFLCGRVSPAALFHFFIICCQSLLCNSATVASLLASFPPALISCASHASTQSASSSCAPSLSTFAIPSVGGISRLLLAFALKAFDLFGVFFFLAVGCFFCFYIAAYCNGFTSPTTLTDCGAFVTPPLLVCLNRPLISCTFLPFPCYAVEITCMRGFTGVAPGIIF